MISRLKQLDVPETRGADNALTFLNRLRLMLGTYMTQTFLVLLFAQLFLPALSAQANVQANPCSAPQQEQFNFWVGEWNLTWPGQNAGETGRGTNSIQRILDGCVVQENFSGGESMHLRGASVSSFDKKSGKWKQTWVDNEGGYLDFVGEFKDGQMIFQREGTRPDGTKVLQRMVWKNITSTEFDWSWEASLDGGKTWQVNWPIITNEKTKRYPRKRNTQVVGAVGQPERSRFSGGAKDLPAMTSEIGSFAVASFQRLKLHKLAGEADTADYPRNRETSTPVRG